MIGKMDRRVTFIKEILETGTSNENKIIGWETIDNNDTVWAEKLEKSGNTVVQNDRITFIQQTDWIIRFRTDLNVRMRLVYDSFVYSITNIAELEDQSRFVKAKRKRYLKINTTIVDNEYFS